MAVAAWLVAPAAAFPQEPVPSAVQPSQLQDIRIVGAKELSVDAVRQSLPVRVGEPFTATLEEVAHAVERRYRDEGYTFARARVEFEQTSGLLTITVDEGVIDGVEFEGVDEKLARIFASEFALHPGDVFNRRRARQALNALLMPTRGAVTASRRSTPDSSGAPTTFHDTRELRERRPTFDLVDRDGQRILRVGLREPPGRFRLSPNLGKREDWFTPVDGFVPALDFGAAVFEHERFNHTFIGGHVSIKAASGNIGYALGFERPFFAAPKLFAGAEVYDLTATDDHWQISSNEASLAAVGPRRSYRDYYERRGLQISSALRVRPRVELLVAWRTERHEALATTSDFSLWNDDEPFRPNMAAREGRLNAVIVGASVDGRGFDRETLEATYRRHQLETPFGARLGDGERRDADIAQWRIDWTSELSSPDALDSDFDFRRHIVSGRVRVLATPHQEVGARAVGGWSDGVLPPQRRFAIGGIGSVHGYAFKEAIGDRIALFNLEYAVGRYNGPQLLAFLDAGRVTSTDPAAGCSVPGAGCSRWLKGAGWGLGLGGFRIDFGYKLESGPKPVQVLLRFGRTF